MKKLPVLIMVLFSTVALARGGGGHGGGGHGGGHGGGRGGESGHESPGWHEGEPNLPEPSPHYHGSYAHASSDTDETQSDSVSRNIEIAVIAALSALAIVAFLVR